MGKHMSRQSVRLSAGSNVVAGLVFFNKMATQWLGPVSMVQTSQ